MSSILKDWEPSATSEGIMKLVRGYASSGITVKDPMTQAYIDILYCIVSYLYERRGQSGTPWAKDEVSMQCIKNVIEGRNAIARLVDAPTQAVIDQSMKEILELVDPTATQ